MAEKEKLAEDVVEYKIFPEITTSNVQQALENVLDTCLAVVSPYLVDFVWQREPFRLTTVSNGNADNSPPHLLGRTSFGDNIEDEWLIVFLLFELSRQIPGLIVKVVDSDGEFLLIEAADALPKWVDPETAENRVFIYNNELHIIPRPQSPADITTLPSSTPSLADAVNCIRNCSSATRASSQVQKSLKARLNEFPDKIKENTHYSHCYIPANLAAVLREKPSLISAGVQAFYCRDPIDLQACRTMQYFRPGTRVISRVKMTRCMYAQLMQQKFTPDKRCGYTLPSTSNPKYTAHDLGMKLAHGFEILCANCNKDGKENMNGHSLGLSNSRWNRYLKSLSEKGYFKNEIEGSQKYNKLLQKAKEFYQHQSINGQERTPADEVLDLLKTVKYDIEEMRRNESQLLPPDDDSWMNISPEDLDALLNKKCGISNKSKTSSSKDRCDLEEVASSMKTFVDQISGVDGVEIPGEQDDAIQFDSTGFISAMTKMFEFEDNDDGSSSDMEEYGWDDSDIDVDDQPPVVQTEKRKQSIKSGGTPSVKDYMDLMDRELTQTEVGKSFEREAKPSQNQDSLTVAQNGTAAKKNKKKSIAEEDDDFQPVNIDMNVVKNMLESLNAQSGLAGPASNILNTMGVKLTPDTEEFPQQSKPSSKKPESDTKRRSSDSRNRPPVPSKPTNLPVPPPRHKNSRSAPTRPAVKRQESKETNV